MSSGMKDLRHWVAGRRRLEIDFEFQRPLKKNELNTLKQLYIAFEKQVEEFAIKFNITKEGK